METFITGGAGYLGRALLRSDWLRDEHVTVYSRDEHKHWTLKAEFPQHRFIIGDVRDADRLVIAMGNTDMLIHAAAAKFVPEGETQAVEFARTNVDGTINAGIAAGMNRVKTAILISTDKAVAPVNNYGATKMIAERIWLDLGTQFPLTRFIVVRYGNVIGSTGSVVELFRERQRQGLAVSVTELSATRYWMTAEQAVNAIERAIGALLTRAIYIPPIHAASMEVLIQALDIYEYSVTGLRPGEKLHEQLIADHEMPRIAGAHYAGYVIGSQPCNKNDLRIAHKSNTVVQLSESELRAMLSDA